MQIGAIKEQLDRLTELEARRQTVLATIEGQGKLTGELRKRIEECWDAVELEDIYLPYKPKRRTRATAARERGLEPLADIVMAQRAHDLLRQAQRFVTAEVATPEEAIAGACDIIAERISEDEQARNTVRRTMGREGAVHSKLVKGKEAEGAKYSDYFDAASPLRSISSHRFLAMRRGEDRGDPAHLDRCRHGAHHRSALPPVHTSRIGNAHIYGGRRGRLAQAAHPTVDRDRAARGRQREGRRRGNRGIRRKPAGSCSFRRRWGRSA